MIASIVITVLVLGFVAWLISVTPIPDPFKTIAIGILIFVAVLAVFSAFGVIHTGLLI